jgi:hypothetical protein
MAEAPLISTIIALSLIPISFFFVHAFLSGLKGWRFHKTTAAIAITWDLVMSLGYMVVRMFGVGVGSSSLEITGPLIAYFIFHGTTALVVIGLEFAMVGTGIWQWRKNKKTIWHKRVSKVLFVLWWIAFATGEIFYIAVYIL